MLPPTLIFFSLVMNVDTWDGLGKEIKHKGYLVTYYHIILMDIRMSSRCRILKSQPNTIFTSRKQTEFTSSTGICCHNTDQGFQFVRHLPQKKKEILKLVSFRVRVQNTHGSVLLTKEAKYIVFS